jgi:hypothetical protein
MASNRGVVYLGPGKVEVQSIDFPKMRATAGISITVVDSPLWLAHRGSRGCRRFRTALIANNACEAGTTNAGRR